MLTGENGILNKATTAKQKTEEATAEEKVKLEVGGSLGEDGKINTADLNKNLGNIEGLTHEGESIVKNPIENLPATVVVDGNNVIIREDGSVVVSEWTQTGYEITNGEITINVGDYVDYDELSKGTQNSTIEITESGHTEQQTLATENLGWRILGIGENGGLELISDKPTSTKVTLLGETGYLNAEEVLNTVCNELYGKGEYAERARSLNVEDINKLANYDPETYNSSYGHLYKYRFSTEAGYMQYSRLTNNEQTWSDWANITAPNNQTFRMPGSTETISVDNPKESKEIENTSYSYTISSKITDTNIANMITNGTSTSNKVWLSSRSIGCNEYYVKFNVHRLVRGGVYVIDMYDSNGSISPKQSYFVRPIVSLQSNIHLEENTEDGWTIK